MLEIVFYKKLQKELSLTKRRDKSALNKLQANALY